MEPIGELTTDSVNDLILQLQLFEVRDVGRKFTGVGKPHDKSADDDGKPVNDSIL